MKVKVSVSGITFSIPVGDGEQSVKWLALCAAQVRMRERASATNSKHRHGGSYAIVRRTAA
jgi:hypothetical protein